MAMLSAVNRWFEQNRWAGDAVVASALLIVLGLVAASRYHATELLATVVLVLPLYARRTYPLPVLLITAGLALLQLVASARPVAGDLVIPVVVHAAAAYIPDRRWGYAALAAGIAGSGLAALRWLAPYGLRDLPQLGGAFLAGVAVVVVAYLLGLRHREQRDRAAEQLAALTERNRLLTAERDSRVAMGAAAERARIARELHDIVAHALSVIVVQADGGAAAARARPEMGPEVLETIARTSRDALSQMRRMVSVLRAGPGDDVPGYVPAPGPADLDDLVAQLRSTGLPVTFETIGSPREMTEGAGLTVYRVVQESLTNVLKHAGPAASCRVVLHYGPAEVIVTVTDDGRGAAAGAAFGPSGDAEDPGAADAIASPGTPTAGAIPGHGLEGMRERVGLQGGSLRAAPIVGGGFEVTATIPYGDALPA
jgi:signal transduction histidine kinase